MIVWKRSTKSKSYKLRSLVCFTPYVVPNIRLTLLDLQGDSITFNAVISACEKSRRWELALVVLELALKQNAADETSCELGWVGVWQLRHYVYGL